MPRSAYAILLSLLERAMAASDATIIDVVAPDVAAVEEFELGLPVAVTRPLSCEVDAVAAPLAPVGVPLAVSSPASPDPVVAVDSVTVDVCPALRAVPVLLATELIVVVSIGVI